MKKFSPSPSKHEENENAPISARNASSTGKKLSIPYYLTRNFTFDRSQGIWLYVHVKGRAGEGGTRGGGRNEISSSGKRDSEVPARPFVLHQIHTGGHARSTYRATTKTAKPEPRDKSTHDNGLENSTLCM